MTRCPKCKEGELVYKIGLYKGRICKRCGYETLPPSLPMKKQKDKGYKKADVELDKTLIKSKIIEQNELFTRKADYHNPAYKFKVLKGKVNWARQKGFKNVRRYVFGGHNVMFTSRGWLVIFKSDRNKVEIKDLEKTEEQIKEEITNIALEISHLYNLELIKKPVNFSSNRPEVKSPYLSNINFIEKEAKAVYKPLPSPIEFIGKNAVKNTVNLTQAIVMLNENILLEIQNKRLHQRVLEDMRDTLKEMRPKKKLPILLSLESVLEVSKKIKEEIECLN